MAKHTSLFRVVVAGLLCLLGLICSPAVDAQTITNIATASWQQSGSPATTQSNAVSFDRMLASASIVTYTVAPGGNKSLNFTASQCGGTPVAVGGGTASVSQIASVAQTTTVQIGSPFYFEVSAPQANINLGAVDSLQVILSTSGGDREVVTVFETGVNTGLFVGAVPTAAVPPLPVQSDCKLSVAAGDTISLAAVINGTTSPIAIAQLAVTTDPYGFIFDSESGASVDGATVTIVDAATGNPATVYAPDGVTAWPSSMITGKPVTDGAGTSYSLAPGEYMFPLVAVGRYRLVVAPPSPYTAPSAVKPENLTGILRPDGSPVEVVTGSYGDVFNVAAGEPLRIDVPVDRPVPSATIVKTASRATAQPGDVVFYTLTVGNPERSIKRDIVVTDRPDKALHIRPNSVRIDGVAAPSQVWFSPDGRQLTVNLGTIAASSSHVITYAATVNQNTTPGQSVNTATVTDSRGMSATTHAIVQILPDLLTDRMTVVGRITAGGCTRAGRRLGIPGVRVMLEDGSYAITDKDGRYHFDGLVPGDHVVQVAPSTLPEGSALNDCSASTRTAGSALSRFVSGQGGTLAVADFYATLTDEQQAALALSNDKAAQAAAREKAAQDRPATPAGPIAGDKPAEAGDDRAAAGAGVDWLAQGDGPIAFLFPSVDYNPRAPVARVAIRHREGQKVELSANGQPVPRVAFDSTKAAASHAFAVSLWTGIPLDGAVTRLVAVVRNPDGSIATTLTRDVFFTNVAARAQLVTDKTHLVADGSTRPVIAFKILDRNGRPVHRGLAGDITISAPYESAEVINALQQRSLSGLGRATPHWTVDGDDGMAYVELAPTMVSGALHLDFTFDDGGVKQRQTIDTWIVPGNLPWTLVGLAEGALGSQSIADRMERTGNFDSDLGTHARTAFYAKGRVLGKYLLTAAYDSAKQAADQTLTGAINPNAYYTVFADGSSRRFDAASRSKLYVRIEARGFYAMFGDFSTALTQTQLARYQRTLTGVSGEATLGNLHLKGFAARTATTHRHLEIQGGGLTGPYSLGTTAMVADSETVNLVVRDRFQSEKIVSQTTLTRFVDYEIDVLSGTISFKAPVLSHDSNGDPQFIVVDMDIDPTLGAKADALVGGGRAEWTGDKGRVRLGMTAISDVGANMANPTARTSLGAVDARVDLSSKAQVRAEFAATRSLGAVSQAWQVDAEVHGKTIDALAYVHSTDQGFGLGDIGNAELGWRKYGVDAKARLNKHLSAIVNAWAEDSLNDASQRRAVQAKAQYRLNQTEFHVGLSLIQDKLAGDSTDTTSSNNSTVIDAGASRKFLHDKLQIDATTSFALGQANSIDLPAKDSFAARYTVTQAVKLIASYDVAHGANLDTHTLRGGFELQPWKGAKAALTAGDQQVAEYGARSFAEFGLSQSVPVARHLSVDASIDMNKVLSGFDASKILNAAQPVVNGGQLNGGGTLTENFTALTLGAAWKSGLWSATLRGEYRDGEFASRHGLTGGLIRQLGDGRVLGAGVTMTHANGTDGSMSSVIDGSVAFATRPAMASYALLAKVEYRADTLLAATSTATASTISGLSGTAGTTALTLGNQHAKRLIASASADWSPRGHNDDETFNQRTEIGLFAAARYNFDRYDGYNLAGTTVMGAVDAHIGIGAKVELGGSASIRTNLTDGTTTFSAGPSIGLVPAKNVLINIGYNFAGYRDVDFAAARTTTRGVFVTLRMKLDTSTFAFLGLDGKAR